MSVIAAAALLAACGDDMYDNSPDEPLKLSLDSITVDLRVQQVTIGVTARDASWTMTGNEEWCEVSPASGDAGVTQVTVAFAAYDVDGALPRTATFTFTSSGETKTVAVKQLSTEITLPNEHPDKTVNQAVHEELELWYYNGEPQSVLPDFNQSYGDFYFNYLSHLNRNTLDGNTWSIDNERFIWSYIEQNPAGTAAMPRPTPPLNYGMEFDLHEFDTRLVARILYVESGSPAAAAGLKRGEWFYKVNDTPMATGTSNRPGFRYYYETIIDSLVNPVAGKSVKLGMLAFNGASETLSDQERTVDITPANFAGSPVFHSQVIPNRFLPERPVTGYTGYMMYNRFDPTYRNELIAAFENLKRQQGGDQISSFILDLRYNKSGSVEMAELMGNLLVGDVEGVAGKTFAEYRFDGGSPVAQNPKTVTFARPESGGVGVDTVFVLTSPHTAGPSELLINALRGLDQRNEVKLVVIGAVTQGLAAGMVKRTVSLGDEWEYSAWMLAFRCRNAEGEGDYMYGLVPNSEVSEWQRRSDNIKWLSTWGWKGQAGVIEDALIKRAMDMIVGRESIPTGEVTNASMRQRTEFPRRFCFPTNMVMTVEN